MTRNIYRCCWLHLTPKGKWKLPLQLIRKRERDIRVKMNISKNFKTFLEACFVSFLVHSSFSSYNRSSIAAVVANIVLALLHGTILNSETALKTIFFRHHVSLFNISWSWNSCPASFVPVKSITMLDSPKCLCIIGYIIAILLFSGISTCDIFIINIEKYFAISHPCMHVWIEFISPSKGLC